MKANELMIGDWVVFPHGIDRIVDLPYIEGGGLCASFAASATLFPVSIEQLKPIPITSEILKKNGFKEESCFFIKRDYDDVIEIFIGNYYTSITYRKLIFNPEDVTECSHECTLTTKGACMVHQLQQFLRLCGIEKEITI